MWLTKQLVELARSIMDGKFRLIMIRGIPGSGKSTLAKQIQSMLKIRSGKIAGVFEVDNFVGDI